VSGEMMAIKKDFTPKKTLDTFTIYASLYTDGKLMDESLIEYDCQRIDPTKCLPEEKNIYTIQNAHNNIIGLAILFFIIVVITLIFIKKRHQIIVLLLLFIAL
jgi:hypothetical protein